MTFDDPKGAFEYSAEVRTVERESSGSVRFLQSRDGTAYRVTIRDERDANLLQVVATRTQMTRDVIIENIQPFVKIPPGLTLGIVSLRGGSVSSEQFAELVNSALGFPWSISIFQQKRSAHAARFVTCRFRRL